MAARTAVRPTLPRWTLEAHAPACLALAACLALHATPARCGPTAHHPGQWTTAQPWPGRSSFGTSVQAVHMALLRGDTLFGRPHSQVMAWGSWAPGTTDGGLWGWNPTTDSPSLAATNLTSRVVPAPPYDVFCAGHATLANGDLLIVGGTERGTTGEAKSARFKIHEQKWVAAPMQSRRWYGNATTPLPDGRMVAFAGNTYHHLVVFGGRNANGSFSSDVQRYAITNQGHWDKTLTGYGPTRWPPPREGHTLSGLPIGETFLFGGKDATGLTRQDTWRLAHHDNDAEQTYRWNMVTPTDLVPPSRWRHAAAAAVGARGSFVYIHGGESVTSQGTNTLNDLWRLEWSDTPVPGWHWTAITLHIGDVPSARSGHSAIWDEERGCMVVYGGQNADGTITDPSAYMVRIMTNAAIWKRLPLAGGSPLPAARTRHAMSMERAATEHTAHGYMPVGLVFGGRTTSGLSNELWEFALSALGDSIHWTLRDRGTGPNAPAPRADASIVEYAPYPRSYVLFGGELAGVTTDASVWEYRFDAPVGWRRLAASALPVRGQRAFLEERQLTALQPEVYQPDSNAWSPFGQPKMRRSYHQMFLASDGKFYSPGPNSSGTDSTWRFDPVTREWSLYATDAQAPLDGTIGGVLYRPDRIMKTSGTGSLFEREGVTSTLAIGTAPQAWRRSANVMAQHPRALQTLSLLPTGEVLANGGIGRLDDEDADPNNDLPRRRPEVWDPTYLEGNAIGRWYGAGLGVPLAEEPVTRAYHSSSMLLPDGRLLSGGGNNPHPDQVKRSVDQFSPPYLFRPDGARAFRPRLYGAQDHIPYDSEFIQVASPDSIVEACLIRPGAATHAFNQDNRYIPLTVYSQQGHQVTLRCAGLNANLVPPGNYLLFVMRDDAGRKVPSVARWVNVGTSLPHYATWDTLPPAAVTDLVITGAGATSRTLSWTAPRDQGIGSSGRATRYELRYRAGTGMATMADFLEFGRRVNPVALPEPGPQGTWHQVTVGGLAPDTVYYFRLVSRDGAGSDRNWSALSNAAATSAQPAAHFQVRAVQSAPGAGEVTLMLDLPAPMPVRLEILDVQGRRIRIVTDQFYAQGTHSLKWDGHGPSGARVMPGVYFYRATAGGQTSQGKVVRLP